MMSETIIMLLAAFGFGLYHDNTRPTQYELELTDGNKASVIIEKNGKYSCPSYCGVNHSHTVEVCGDGCTKHHHNHYIHNFRNENITTASIKKMTYGEHDIQDLKKVSLNRKSVFEHLKKVK